MLRHTFSIVSLTFLITLASITNTTYARPVKLAHSLPLRSHHSQTLDLEGDYTLLVTKLPFKVKSPHTAEGTVYFWELPGGWKGTKLGHTLTVTEASGNGTINLQTFRTDWEAKKNIVESYSITLTVGKQPAPPPPGPDPPKPDPDDDKDPPDPFGKASTASVGVGPLKVLIIFETKDAAKLSKEHRAVIYGDVIHAYLNSKCGPDPDVASWKAWRVFDQHQPGLDKINPMWQRVMSRPRTTLPWIVIGNGRTGYEGPLPSTIEATLTLLKRFGG